MFNWLKKLKSETSNVDVKVSQQSSVPRQPIKRSNPHRILICDDAAFMRMMLKNVLTQDGYEVVAEAQDGLEAIERYSEFKPDLVFMDTTMPTIDGIEATRKIMKRDSHANIVICSAMGQEKLVMEAIRLGAKDFIVKPFHPEAILKAVVKIFEPWRIATTPVETEQSQTVNTTPTVQTQYTQNKTVSNTSTVNTPIRQTQSACNINDYNSYLKVLEQYYSQYGEEAFLNSEIQKFRNYYRLDKLGITSNDVIDDLLKIKKTADITQDKTTTPPVQTHRTQVQNISNNILDEYMLIETVRTMPLWLNSESVSISKNSSINSLCAGLVNNAMSDFATQETFVQFENIIQQKRLRTSNKAEYNRKMENNIFYELFCYSYLINVFEAVPKIMSGSLNVNFEKYVSLAENECRERVQNLEQEKRKIYNIEMILNKYNQSTTQYKMPNLGLINQRENDFIIAQLMHNCVIPCIAPLFYDSKEQWKIFDTISAKEFAQTLDVYLSQAISMRLSTYAGDKIFNI